MTNRRWVSVLISLLLLILGATFWWLFTGTGWFIGFGVVSTIFILGTLLDWIDRRKRKPDPGEE